MKSFQDFAGVHAGRSAALICTGQSLAHFRPLEQDLILCGVNTAFLSGLFLDYLFLQDVGWRSHVNSYTSRKQEYDEYHPRIAKFYGTSLCKELGEACEAAHAIPYAFSHAPLIRGESSIVEDPSVFPRFCGDLSGPDARPAAAGSITFPALQFLLHTGVSKIYVVGADILSATRYGEKPGSNQNDYERQNFLPRWLEFKDWVTHTYPQVSFVNVNPVGLSGIFPEVWTYPRLRFHALGIPMTVTSKEYTHCAFTQKLRRFSEMMTRVGHTVYHYGHIDSDVVCSEHIPVTDNATLEAEFGDYHWKTKQYQPRGDGQCIRTFTRNTVPQIQARHRPGDFTLCWYGSSHKGVADAVPQVIAVEPSVGYRASAWAPHKVFESYAMMHTYYGMHEVKRPPFYDSVIPGFLDTAEFQYQPQKQDYVLYCGRLNRDKGVTTAVEACRRSGDRLIIAGQGTLAEAGVKELPPHAEFVGYLDYDERIRYMAHAKALMCPTAYMEPFGYVAIEALMCGTPVISTDWGGFSETVLPGVTGFRCRTLAHFEYALRHLGEISTQRCRQWAESNYSLERAIIRYSEYFLRLGGLYSGNDFNGRSLSARGIAEIKRDYPWM